MVTPGGHYLVVNNYLYVPPGYRHLASKVTADGYGEVTQISNPPMTRIERDNRRVATRGDIVEKRFDPGVRSTR